MLMMADQKGKSMIMGTGNGFKFVYDLPENIKNVEQMNSLIYDYNYNESQRDELQGQPKLLGLNGPMYNGTRTLKSTGEEVVVIRYELPEKFTE